MNNEDVCLTILYRAAGEEPAAGHDAATTSTLKQPETHDGVSLLRSFAIVCECVRASSTLCINIYVVYCSNGSTYASTIYFIIHV